MPSWTLADNLHIKVPEFPSQGESKARRNHMATKKSSKKLQKGKKLEDTKTLTTFKNIEKLPAVQ
jgi:hypothetical protein